jgi:site-specific recombinase XerD
VPTLIAALERHGHLQLSEETRGQLLSMSPATADRLLCSHRTPAPRGLGTTKAGPLLKEQIPIRTFQQWDTTRPGFLEADLVAHCGKHTQGSYLYTLTLTDVATGWTECLPVLYKSPEAVLSAFQQARTLFPFPILGLDVDNGGEFINLLLMHYCQTEQITFTRGREDLKADQCFVEQKNGAIVRQFAGHGRLVGEQAYRQLRELYRAVRLYVNCFQPSMKMLSKHREEEKVRRVYDAAKTPLHRLLLSGIVSPERQQHLRELEEALDPLRLLQQLENLQRAAWHRCVDASLLPHVAPAASILSFCIHDCLQGTRLAQEKTPAGALALQPVQAEAAGSSGVLDWPRTSKDPFEGEWERILSLVLSHPEWSGSDLFQQMQRLFPGRYRSSQQRTLQLGLRKIRARLLSMQEPWPQEVIQALSIEQAIQSYLQEQRASARSFKTLEWHQTALGLFQQYLVSERHLHLLCQITEAEVRGWVAFLQNTPSTKDTARSAGTIATYARSVRAFCHWAVRNGHLANLPIVCGTMPKAGSKPIHVIEPDEFERLLLACRAARESEGSGARAAARNRAILWVFLDTGMRVSELCALRLSDVDREHRALRVRGTGGSERWIALSPNGWYQVLSYLERYRPKEGCRQDGDVEDDHLFLSEWYRPLTSNSLTLLFDRLWKRSGISDKPVSPSALRDTFAVRFLQAGGELDALGSVLGLKDKAALKRYARVSTQRNKNDVQKESTEGHSSEPVPAPHKSRRRRRRFSATATRNQRQRVASRRDGAGEKEPVTDAEEDP